MSRIRLIRTVDRPSGRGPGNGQFALQRALRARRPDWLEIGGTLQESEIPWFWCWLDRLQAAGCGLCGQPFVAGPNVLFDNSRNPGAAAGERGVLEAASCRLLFTESQWYRSLIQAHLGPLNRAPIVIWPYPIEPRPAGPVYPAQNDLLIYVKARRSSGLVDRLRQCYGRCRLIRYGRYGREQLWDTARRSRCCLYLSDDDRGPLALSEILLCGCPAVGVTTGAPFIRHGRTGIVLNRFSEAECIEAIEDCLEFDRRRVAAVAAEQFDTDRIVDTIIDALARVHRHT